MKEMIKGANPYLPLWEHIPDGEPRCFTYNGETRVYIYGSHDTLKTEYCGTDYVVWSAPADDLTNWRCDGICYESMSGEPLYAPDVVEKNGTYYMYVAEDRGSKVYVASSKSPTGPFENPVLTELGFDPGVLVDDDGRIYAYWGFCRCSCAELNDDMATIKKETFVADMIPHAMPPEWIQYPETEHIDKDFSFFEASSIRKVDGKYVFIYSRRIDEADEEKGLPARTNGYLDYAYSDTPLGNWVHGGMISYNCGDIYIKSDGTKARAYVNGNNHGSIIEANGQWYIFYHRQTANTEYARQGMLEPIDAVVGKDGKVYIGKVEYDEHNEPINACEVEMTSQGAHTNGMCARKIISAGYACYLTESYSGELAYIDAVYEEESSPIINIKSGTVAGFKYVDFGEVSPSEISITLRKAISSLKITVTADAPNGVKIAEVNDSGKAELCGNVTGKRAVFFAFEADDEKKNVCEFDTFTFN